MLCLVNAACGQSEKKPEEGAAQPPAAVVALSADENAAAASHGARAIATSTASEAFVAGNLNDGTPLAWGAAEGTDDTYAAIVLPNPQVIKEFRISLFSPNTPPRAHLRDVRVVVADSEDKTGTKWQVVRSRLLGAQSFSEKVTVPLGADGSIVKVEIDTSDPNFKAHRIWGIACLSGTRGDARNYLEPGTGTGMYVRELQMK
jgi:hypothetical protein